MWKGALWGALGLLEAPESRLKGKKHSLAVVGFRVDFEAFGEIGFAESRCHVPEALLFEIGCLFRGRSGASAGCEFVDLSHLFRRQVKLGLSDHSR
jgi:hypothetical protein